MAERTAFVMLVSWFSLSGTIFQRTFIFPIVAPSCLNATPFDNCILSIQYRLIYHCSGSYEDMCNGS